MCYGTMRVTQTRNKDVQLGARPYGLAAPINPKCEQAELKGMQALETIDVHLIDVAGKREEYGELLLIFVTMADRLAGLCSLAATVRCIDHH